MAEQSGNFLAPNFVLTLVQKSVFGLIIYRSVDAKNIGPLSSSKFQNKCRDF